ncbi:MAG: alpha/beta hydrolase [Myxococcales bacterium]|nr:alpha/beta hydrolase [Myxococcales bacterium]
MPRSSPPRPRTARAAAAPRESGPKNETPAAASGSRVPESATPDDGQGERPSEEPRALVKRPGAPVATPGRHPRQRQGFAVARDGSALFYRVHEPAEGVPQALPVVFNDGIGCDGYVWKYLEPELTQGRAIIHWHYRGHGRTPMPRDLDRVSIADSADDLVSVLDTVGVDRAVLAGHSMGVQVCLEAYRRAPERIAGFVLMCGSYGNPLRTFKGKRTLEDVLPAVRFAIHRIPRLVTAFWRNVIPTDLAYQIATRMEINGALIRREDFFPYLEHIASVDVRLFVDMLSAAGRHTAREILPTIAVPTFILAGDRDSFTPLSLSEEMHRLIPGSELMVVKDGSHTTPIEKPGEVCEAIAAFLRGI